ncbi:marine proteobacterial sortase target protein [Pokkaliibacter sp. MBI-7]|uniref:marine proteobacterial sortase target protein n=1 Tax=Pokkaliibacter sp. MBI-7 TaxID=3040600 RepID=UPI002446EB7B|nr:marine proteobacterial sortase target protein [Pokkaliibacter sp. MBI-7]MDH2431764.1 marine proteobacterial sortase target protein [Pokkaliibacter sp. MBI-7]
MNAPATLLTSFRRKPLVLLLSLCMASAAHATETREEPGIGMMLVQTPAGVSQPMTLLDTAYDVSVTGMQLSAEVTQHFSNPSSQWANARYVFPLPEKAAVRRLLVTIGERQIEGLIREKDEARQTFEQAKAEGRQAALVEQQRANLFSIEIANVAPGAAISVELEYVDQVSYRDGQFSLRIPTTLTPRYIPGFAQMPDSFEQVATSGHGWALPTDVVADADKITPPQIATALSSDNEPDGESEQIRTHQLAFRAHLDTGLALDSVSSSTDAIHWQASASGVDVSLEGQSRLDHDLALSWTPKPSAQPQAALFTQQQGGQHYGLLMVMPPVIRQQPLPREVTFVIDTSGSMAGESIRQARDALQLALDRLSPQDRFNVIEFNSSTFPLFSNPRPADEYGLTMARRFVNGLDADGGTEMYGALQQALRERDERQWAPEEGYLQQIVFITDGAVGDEARLFELINQQLGDKRLFTVGIGSAPNSYFMRKAAQFGRGTFTYIANPNDVAPQMNALFNKLESPVARELVVNWPQGAQVEQYPQRVPDLYAGEPLMMAFRSEQPVTSVEVSGKLGIQPWQQSAQAASSADNSLGSLWAREKIESLLDTLSEGRSEEEIRPQVLALGLAHHLLTPYTSLVAVDKEPVKPMDASSQDQAIANLMPLGNTMTLGNPLSSLAFPSTATPAELLSMLATAMLILAALVAWLQRRQQRLDCRKQMAIAVRPDTTEPAGC